ncbi:MAG: DotU family type IV/VI secretion system protein [Puniceicoccales bacterium]|jgi:hypothetical protein|nr:DotU family type IV/VI secretion system protein [Puniceicoccales bacterium]
MPAPTEPKKLALPQLCEPIFQEICRLNRIARKAPSGDFNITRAAIKDLLTKTAERAKTDPALAANFEKVELPILFFIDSLLSESALPYANEWNQKRLAYERNELAGDEKFFDLLDETLAQNNDAANERLVIFYTMLGLGFTGWYQGQNEFLRKKMKEIQPRIRAWVDSDETGLISPDAYKHTNTTNLPLPLGSILIPLLILILSLFFIVVAANVILFRNASSDLRNAVDLVKQHEKQRIKEFEERGKQPLPPPPTPPPAATPALPEKTPAPAAAEVSAAKHPAPQILLSHAAHPPHSTFSTQQ